MWVVNSVVWEIAMKIQWEQSQRERAKAENKGLFAVASDTDDGVWKIGGLMSHELCRKAAFFVLKLYKLGDPRAAFDETWPSSSPNIRNPSRED